MSSVASAPDGTKYTGKTAAILRDGLRKAALGQAKVAVTMPDGEDGATATLNELSYVAISRLEQPLALSAAVEAAMPLREAIPDLTACHNNPTLVMATISAHQRAIVEDMVQREAGREALRRQLLEHESVEWRRAQMETAFTSDRMNAQEVIKQTLQEHEAALSKFRVKYEKEAAAAARVQAVLQNRAKALAQAAREAEEES
jgi:hypothetical protein